MNPVVAVVRDTTRCNLRAVGGHVPAMQREGHITICSSKTGINVGNGRGEK